MAYYNQFWRPLGNAHCWICHVYSCREEGYWGVLGDVTGVLLQDLGSGLETVLLRGRYLKAYTTCAGDLRLCWHLHPDCFAKAPVCGAGQAVVNGRTRWQDPTLTTASIQDLRGPFCSKRFRRWNKFVVKGSDAGRLHRLLAWFTGRSVPSTSPTPVYRRTA